MAEDISIWRWAVSDDLEALFARAVAAEDAEFAALGDESAADDPATLDDIEARAEARFRTMDLPPEVMETMMTGFRDMMAEARADEAERAGDDPDPDGRVGFALASSHMFYDAPYAALENNEIARQVQAKLDTYRAAISRATGAQGQSLATFLGISPERGDQGDTFDALTKAGLAEVVWIWVADDQVCFLSQWQEDRQLPIDLEFGRAPRGIFDAVRAVL